MDPAYEHDQFGELPSSVHTEIAILGAMLLDVEAIADAIDDLHAEDFSLDSHQRIYRVILGLLAANHAIDFLTVQDALAKRRELEAIGGPAYLAYLTEGIPRNLNIQSYVRIVKDKSILRETFQIQERGRADILAGPENATDVIDAQIASLQALRETTRDSSMQAFGTYLANRYDADPDSAFADTALDNGIDLGYPQLQEMTCGPQPGELWIVAARPSIGKTAWSTSTICQTVLRHDPARVAAFFLEQSERSAEGRMLCARAEADFKRYRAGKLGEREKSRIREAIADFREAPLYWCGESSLTVSQISAKCRRLDRELKTPRDQRGLDLIIVDQLSFVSADDFYRKGMQRDEIAGGKVKAMKAMAKKLNKRVILMAQISRASTKNKDQVPTLADIAESGQIEQHADVVLFLHRAEFYDPKNTELHNKGQFIVAKNRDGQTGDMDVQYIKSSCKWWDDKAKEESFAY